MKKPDTATPVVPVERDDNYYLASQWELMWRKFKRHRMALAAAGVLLAFYLAAAFTEFGSPYGSLTRTDYLLAPPSNVHILHEGRLRRPFVYGLEPGLNMETLQRTVTEKTEEIYPIKLFSRGTSYRLWGAFDGDLHLFGVDRPGVIFLFGTDELGRDMFSRMMYASRISLSIGLAGVIFSFILGVTLGGISGYYGGAADMAVQRMIEFLLSIPTLPLWMALSAALPPDWSSIRIYFGITIILSLVGWGGLARVVRGKLLELRGEDFILAARIAGETDGGIISRHLIPSFMSYLIVHLTLAVPGMILGETALSFLGLGLRPPVVSWGVLLQNAQNFRSVVLHPWLLIPVLLVIGVVLAFNFLGDGLRDAADPYT